MYKNSHFIFVLGGNGEQSEKSDFHYSPVDLAENNFECTKYNNSVFYKWFVNDTGSLNKSWYYESDDFVFVIMGTLYNYFSLNEIITTLHEIRKNNIGEFINRVSGSFCGFVYFKQKSELISFTDRLGVQKLYFVEKNDRVIITSSFDLARNYIKSQNMSSIAFSSTVLLSHTIDGTVFPEIKQVDAGCYRNHSRKEQTEYIIFPQRKNVPYTQAMHNLNKAFDNFFIRIKPFVDNNIGLFMSRGKDCRVLLKFMLDNSTKFNYYSFFRDNQSMEPFVSFKLKSKDDYYVARQMAKANNIDFNSLLIDNNYLLKNLDFLIKVNEGTPLHWEFSAAAKKLYAKNIRYMITGFMGDPFAGKNKHRYLFCNSIHNADEYAKFSFKFSTPKHVYFTIKKICARYGLELSSYDEIQALWQKKYEIIQNKDLDNIYIFGLTRTRGIGRVIPTFHQARTHSIPIYPYLDTEIMNAYLALPPKCLSWEKAHLDLIAQDKRFSEFRTTRFPASAKTERKILMWLGILRRGLFYKENILKPTRIDDVEKNRILLKTLSEFEQYPNDMWKEIINYQNKTKNYYGVVANLISALRIEKSISTK